MRSKGFVALILAVAALAAAARPADGATVPPPPARKTDPAWQNWRKTLREHLPKSGCFKAAYPKVAWQKVQCAPAPDVLFASEASAGNIKGYMAWVAGNLYWASGMLTTSGLTSESGVYKGVDTPNAYSLQLNTNRFSTPACQHHKGCQGWQQFIYASMQGKVFIQFWLLRFGKPCPSGWQQAGESCVKNSQAMPVGLIPATKLDDVVLEGDDTGKSDYAILYDYDSKTTYAASAPDSTLGLGEFQYWITTEFNVDGTASGRIANFNSGTTIWVNIQVDYGSLNAPYCAAGSTITAESNNLILSYTPPAVIQGEGNPVISFMEANPAGSQGSQCFATKGG